jgi:1-acyl-sn-glycerol-3-phosphate acyltransferase
VVLIRFFRSILVIVVALVSTLAISLGALFIVHLLRRPSTSTRFLAEGWGKLVLWTAGVKVRKEGASKLDPGTPYIFAANHQSQFDIFVLNGYLGHTFSWLAKKELFQVPIWGRAMKAAGYIPIDRSHGREAMKSLTEAAARIAAGTSVVIFPEGTRSPDGRLREFKSGGMVLAIKSGVAIVPVAVTGTHRVLPKGAFLARPGGVTVRVGEPIDVSTCGPRQKQELAARVHSAVAGMMESPGAIGGEKGPGAGPDGAGEHISVDRRGKK